MVIIINEKYRQLKNSFDRLNTLFQESLEEVDRMKSEYTAKLLESNEKYRVTLKENEELKKKFDVLFNLGRSYIDKADNKEPKEASKEKEKDMIEEITIEDNHDHEISKQIVKIYLLGQLKSSVAFEEFLWQQTNQDKENVSRYSKKEFIFLLIE